MKTTLALVIACLSLQCVPAAQAQPVRSSSFDSAQQCDQYENQQRPEVEKAVKSYEKALNASDVRGVMQVYTDDPAVLVPEAPTAVGSRAVWNTYTGLFQAISLSLTFDVAEVKFLSPEWAFLRSTSKGSIKILANGAQIPSSNQELFVLHKEQSLWKVARYSFSSVLPTAK